MLRRLNLALINKEVIIVSYFIQYQTSTLNWFACTIFKKYATYLDQFQFPRRLKTFKKKAIVLKSIFKYFDRF